MLVQETTLKGAFTFDPQYHRDRRGLFARTFCEQEFAAVGIHVHMVQSNISGNTKKGTLRGMHFQIAPHEEGKLVRCTRGSIFDVIIDLRPASATFRKWQGFELTAGNHRGLYIPPGFAHGFQTLEDDSEVFYQMTAFFHKESARGVRWNDPAFGIKWPLLNPILSDADAGYPDFQ